MAQVINNSGHDDMIHDAVLDYYGRRLATCSSDKTIKIFEIDGENHKLTETLRGHEGAVWCVSWAHPKYGNILASSSYDGKVLIWREQNAQWSKVADFHHHNASVNIVNWSPHEKFNEGNWAHVMIDAHGPGVNAVSWAPAMVPGSLVSSKPELGAQRSQEQSSYVHALDLHGHTDWVRDVAWAPTVLQKSYIASASQDKTVRIWTSDPAHPNEWKSTVLNFDAVLWRVSWSLSGNVLAVSGGDNKVSLWKENLKGEWDCVKWIEE
ncbi:MAG: hypothetical protein Q9203_000870 [Teloschistes exilis]